MFLRYRLQSGKLAELLLPQTWTVGFARNYDFRHRSLLILRFFELINFLYIWPSVLLDFGSNLGFEEILLKFQTTPGFEPPSMLVNGLGYPLRQLPILNFKLCKKKFYFVYLCSHNQQLFTSLKSTHRDANK